MTSDGNGDVLGGEQDYNDGNGITSQQPAGDTILPATAALSISTPAIGQGTLTLTTSNPAVGVDGVETFGILFVNDNHALISQFDASATSTGSLDLQTAGTPSRGFAFTVSGVDAGYDPIAFGGVFTYGGSGANGVVDSNDAGAVTPQEPLTITINAGDSYGRGTITSSLVYGTAAILLNYYMVGPEAIRIIDVDATDSAVGSAFGQNPLSLRDYSAWPICAGVGPGSNVAARTPSWNPSHSRGALLKRARYPAASRLRRAPRPAQIQPKVISSRDIKRRILPQARTWLVLKQAN